MQFDGGEVNVMSHFLKIRLYPISLYSLSRDIAIFYWSLRFVT